MTGKILPAGLSLPLWRPSPVAEALQAVTFGDNGVGVGGHGGRGVGVGGEERALVDGEGQ